MRAIAAFVGVMSVLGGFIRCVTEVDRAEICIGGMGAASFGFLGSVADRVCRKS